MSDFIIAGHCMHCDAPCWEVKQVWTAGERYPGEPKRLGKLVTDAVRVSFMLLDGNRIDVTLCADCGESFNPEHYVSLWSKIQRSWHREMTAMNKPIHDWFWKSFDNLILAEMGRVKWRELASG